MVIQNIGNLDDVFAALADSTRRGMLERLSRGPANISTLAQGYDMSQPAISKHMRVLEKAGLIRRVKQGREVRVSVNTQTAEQARDWIAYYTRFWKQQFDAVEQYLDHHHLKNSSTEEQP